MDYKKQDFSDTDKQYDAILGINGCNPLSKYKKTLKKGGIYVGVGNMMQCMQAYMLGWLVSIGSGKKLCGSTYFLVDTKECFPYIEKGITEGYIKPYIDHVYEMKDIQNALNYVVISLLIPV